MRPLLVFLTFMMSLLASAQNFTLPLWSGSIPNSRQSDQQEHRDSSNIVRISHVQDPTLEVYLPSKRNASGQAVVICPGGGYRILAYDWEGTDVAKYLNAHGIAAMVLKYRLPDTDSNEEPHQSPLMDAQQAMKIVRSNAQKWNINTDKVGIMGFSAGGHLASTLGTHYDTESKPNFMALIYPVISMSAGVTHMGSRTSLLGNNPSADLINHYSNELQITEQTPPTFLLHASDDQAVVVKNSLLFYQGLVAKGVPAEMHIYPSGGHGFGLGLEHEHLSSWPDRLMDWLESLNR